ncbi:NAD(P)/FAD-dependent oxidoreductase [Streptococcus macacae]|uniref:FAD dependent oxidoreductase n=1 Tax=Streptococcus macacae NCTC 11558 TaxID=764298 RepID=G5JVN7_9STRE|nr:FAD-dependent oxidoreductase [Streptococcus macacae]EHJ53304.1 FAD dependent oxidoreductase [Streptococcus macacae NCTC 11558]SUN78705.1 oxidoreductase [Streptococcus macacae NCTC 11558]
MKKVAVIGAGIVGSAAAYYLSKETDLEVTVFDDGAGQASKAAAGIICPWFSKRRNKSWYRLARLGADFYQTLVSDLQADNIKTDFYDQAGVFLLKKKDSSLEELYELAKKRREQSPLIGQLSLQSRSNLPADLADLNGFDRLLYASGAARVEGSVLTKTLLAASRAEIIRKRVSLNVSSDGNYWVSDKLFDAVFLACGAWLPQILKPLGYEVDIRPQKGQLRDYFFKDSHTGDYPVIMPEGELDIIPFAGGKVSIGATHENEQGFDLCIDSRLLDALEREAQTYFPKLNEAYSKSERVGTRAYTSDFSPFFGQVPQLKKVYAASGLGSSGLTSGPLIAYQLVQQFLHKELLLPADDYSPNNYIVKGS